jgi:hypothetical protein
MIHVHAAAAASTRSAAFHANGEALEALKGRRPRGSSPPTRLGVGAYVFS